MQQATGPLQGIRIVDMTSVLMGPFATQILADYGADVIKIESAEGDLLRLGGALRNPKMGSLYLQTNRNKRSVVLDAKSEQGRTALLALCDGRANALRKLSMPRANALRTVERKACHARARPFPNHQTPFSNHQTPIPKLHPPAWEERTPMALGMCRRTPR